MAIMSSLSFPTAMAIGTSVNTRRCFSRSVPQPHANRCQMLMPTLHHRKLPQISNTIILRSSENPPCVGGGGGKGGNSGGGSGWRGSGDDDDDGRPTLSQLLGDELSKFKKDLKEEIFTEDGKRVRLPYTGKYWFIHLLGSMFYLWLIEYKTHFFRDVIAEIYKDDDGWSSLTKRTT